VSRASSRVRPFEQDLLPFEKSEIEQPIGTRFEKVARTVPDRPAVREPGRVTTYAELDANADRIASVLVGELATRPGGIALMLEAGAPLFAAMLGALKAGRFYVPLDPRLPFARLKAISHTLGPAALICSESDRMRARSLVPEDVPLWLTEELTAAPNAPDAGASVSPDHLAYVLFTSGSTGNPKGVMQSHRNVLHNVWKLATALALRSPTSSGHCSQARRSAPTRSRATACSSFPIS
jgi:non-ribosomal peptide synthetase component F